MADLRNPFQPPPAPDQPNAAPEKPLRQVACRECGAPAELHPGQRMPKHNIATVGPGGIIRDSGIHCAAGTGQPPEVT
jgi:hypothetical protein